MRVSGQKGARQPALAILASSSGAAFEDLGRPRVLPSTPFSASLIFSFKRVSSSRRSSSTPSAMRSFRSRRSRSAFLCACSRSARRRSAISAAFSRRFVSACALLDAGWSPVFDAPVDACRPVERMPVNPGTSKPGGSRSPFSAPGGSGSKPPAAAERGEGGSDAAQSTFGGGLAAPPAVPSPRERGALKSRRGERQLHPASASASRSRSAVSKRFTERLALLPPELIHRPGRDRRARHLGKAFGPGASPAASSSLARRLRSETKRSNGA